VYASIEEQEIRKRNLIQIDIFKNRKRLAQERIAYLQSVYDSGKGSYEQVTRSVELYMDSLAALNHAKQCSTDEAIMLCKAASHKIYQSDKYAEYNLLPECLIVYKELAGTFRKELNQYWSDCISEEQEIENSDWETSSDQDKIQNNIIIKKV
jgi:hypothetical protein